MKQTICLVLFSLLSSTPALANDAPQVAQAYVEALITQVTPLDTGALQDELQRVDPDANEQRMQLHRDLGFALLLEGERKSARQHLRDAQALEEAQYGKKSVRLIDTLFAIGRTFKPRLKDLRKETIRAQLLAKSLGAGSMDRAYFEMASALAWQDVYQLARAKADTKTALKILRKQDPVDQALVDENLLMLATIEYQNRNRKKARKAFEDLLGAHPRVANTARRYLVSIYEQTGQPDKATQYVLALGAALDQWPEQPLPLHWKQPNYPMAARSGWMAGDVLLRFTIDADGYVQNPQIVSGPEVFHTAALDAISVWRYAPRFIDGNPVDTHDVEFVMDFKPTVR